MPQHDFDRIVQRRDGDSIKWNKYPEDVLPMWVADSDFTAPEPVVRAIAERAAQGVFGYSGGQEGAFKQAVAHWTQSRFGWQALEDWAAFAPSVVISLALCVRTFTDPGDAVLFLTPSYPPFFSIPRSHGREALTSSLLHENGRYCIDFADLEAKMALPRARMLILCNPHNPTGRVFGKEDLLRIGGLCLKHNLLIFSDEIHCDYVFTTPGHLPFASLSHDLAMRTLTAINPSKTFNIADLHCSAILCANPHLLTRFKSAAESMGLHSNAFGMLGLVTAYTGCAWYADQVAAYVKGNLDFAADRINSRIPGIRCTVPEATYLLWLDCRELGLNQEDLERFFLEKAKVALNSGTDFGEEGRGFMRMNLACPRETILEGLARLENAATA